MVKDSLAVIAPVETAIGRPTATARRLVDVSLSPNIRSAYARERTAGVLADYGRTAADRGRGQARSLTV